MSGQDNHITEPWIETPNIRESVNIQGGFFDRSTIKNKVSDYKVKPIKKVQVSEFPKGLSLCQFYGRPVKKTTIKNNNDHIQM